MRVIDGDITEQEAALEGLKKALKKVLERGRTSTMRKLVGILSPGLDSEACKQYVG